MSTATACPGSWLFSKLLKTKTAIGSLYIHVPWDHGRGLDCHTSGLLSHICQRSLHLRHLQW